MPCRDNLKRSLQFPMCLLNRRWRPAQYQGLISTYLDLFLQSKKLLHIGLPQRSYRRRLWSSLKGNLLELLPSSLVLGIKISSSYTEIMNEKREVKLQNVLLVGHITWAVVHIERDKEAVARKKPPMIQLFVVANIVDGNGCDWWEL